MTSGRILLVEDDASLQRFFVLALSQMPVQVQCCASVDAALEALRLARFDLIVTDLMLPGRSGFELLETLAAEPALGAGADCMVFSAGLSPPVRERLAALGARRVLSKPCTVGELEDAVRQGLTLSARPGHTAVTDGRADAVASHFGGQQALYDAYRLSCLRQFREDLLEGDRACAAIDAQGLRRLAHNLKSVLLILGHRQASLLARRLEDCADAGDWNTALPAWHALRERVRLLD